jgi:hypothetical protein
MGRKIFAGLGVITFLAFMSLGIKVGETLPDHAILLVDEIGGTYITIPCVISGNSSVRYAANLEAFLQGKEQARLMPDVRFKRKDDIRVAGFKPDKKCRDSDGFVHLRPWIFSVLGIGSKRVAGDGTVLW